MLLLYYVMHKLPIHSFVCSSHFDIVSKCVSILSPPGCPIVLVFLKLNGIPKRQRGHFHLEANRIRFLFRFRHRKNFFLYFSAFYFWSKTLHIFSMYFVSFSRNMAVKITENSECFNSADAQRAS